VRGNVAFWHIARSKDNQALYDITAYDLMTIMDKLTSLRAFRESGRTRQLLALYPELRIHLVLSDEQIDPVQGGYDVTLRIADLEDSSLIARKIVAIDRVICAVPSYLDEHGVPKHPGDLRRHAHCSASC
jgi:DNA-binding transcriptional LysR family regulator